MIQASELGVRGQWIKLNDKLPENRQICIVWGNSRHDKTYCRKIARYIAEGTYTLPGWIGAHEVTHWMPAPNPPLLNDDTQY